jgi:exodeoxyribonuclease VII small subunit
MPKAKSEKTDKAFEREEVDLEEGLKKFERGLELAKGCKERLREVENKVVQIKAKFGEMDGEDDGEPQRLL